MEYDFSKIDTDDLRLNQRVYDDGQRSACNSIQCTCCPFDNTAICMDNPKIHELFKAELERRESMKQEYKEITLDMSIKEIMELDLERLEFFHNNKWLKSLAGTHKELVRYITNGDIYRYKGKQLEVAKIPKSLVKYLQDYASPLYLKVCKCNIVWDNIKLVSIDGHKVEIIGEDKC